MASDKAILAAAVFGGACAGAVCGMLPLGLALKRGRVAAGTVSMLLCVGAGMLGGLCLGIPTAVGLAVFVSLMGRPRSMYPVEDFDDPPAGPSARTAAYPYTRIGPTVVCNDCHTATRADGAGGVPPECPECGLPFRRVSDEPKPVRRKRDSVIDLTPAPPVKARPVGRG
jgi:hypothetical protein